MSLRVVKINLIREGNARGERRNGIPFFSTFNDKSVYLSLMYPWKQPPWDVAYWYHIWRYYRLCRLIECLCFEPSGVEQEATPGLCFLRAFSLSTLKFFTPATVDSPTHVDIFITREGELGVGRGRGWKEREQLRAFRVVFNEFQPKIKKSITIVDVIIRLFER